MVMTQVTMTVKMFHDEDDETGHNDGDEKDQLQITITAYMGCFHLTET